MTDDGRDMKFGIIFADPPWAYARTSKTRKLTPGNAKLSGYCDTEYEVLTTESLCALPVAELGADNSVLLLCATWPFLPDALRVIKAWGYDFVTGLTWIKTGKKLTDVSYGVGYWFRGATELVLVGKRGRSYRTNLVGLVTDDLVSERLNHSRKPQSMYEVGEAFPEPRLELFARHKQPGWYALGNECPGDGMDIAKRLDKLTRGIGGWEKHRG